MPVVREYACGIFMHSVEKSDCVSDAQSLCGIALNLSCKGVKTMKDNKHIQDMKEKLIQMPWAVLRSLAIST